MTVRIQPPQSWRAPAWRRTGPPARLFSSIAGRRWALTLFCTIGLACTPGGDARTTPDDMVAVSAFLVTLDRLPAEAEPAELIALVADDAVILPPGEPALVGKRAIAERYNRLREHYQPEITHEDLEVDRFGDVILSRATVKGAFLPGSSGRPAPLDGKCLLALKLDDDGSLRLWRYMINAERDSA